ncbi:MAG: hypothetical protein RL754_1293 [Bacteroidota bacterium]|jgi:2'-hydroxyisoflavone reductase
MNKSRRAFIKTGVLSSLGIPLAASGFGQTILKELDHEISILNNKPLKILILGGTSFLGIHQLKYALDRGHQISIFTRGKTQPNLYPEVFEQVEHLIGDRKNDLTALEKGNWDVVIDNSGYDASWTDRSASLLKERCNMYVYTSSIGVYYPYLGSDFTEERTVLLKEPEAVEKEEERIEYWYGVMKANSELAALKHFGPDRTLIIRPTYMIGPADKTNRFIHWPIRLSRGGNVLVPGKKNDPVQYIDVRDVAEWMIRLIESNTPGTFNAAGPRDPKSMWAFVNDANEAFPADCTLIPIDDYDFLTDEGIVELVPWVMPTGNNAGSSLASTEKAMQHGLTLRPLKETIIDTHRWWNSGVIPPEVVEKVENNPESVLLREPELLAKWNKLQKE